MDIKVTSKCLKITILQMDMYPSVKEVHKII